MEYAATYYFETIRAGELFLNQEKDNKLRFEADIIGRSCWYFDQVCAKLSLTIEKDHLEVNCFNQKRNWDDETVWMRKLGVETLQDFSVFCLIMLA